MAELPSQLKPKSRFLPFILFLLAATVGSLGITYFTFSTLSPASLYLICGIATYQNTAALSTAHLALGITGLLSACVLAWALGAHLRSSPSSGFSVLLGVLLALATAVNLAFMPGARPLPLAGAAVIGVLSVLAFLSLGE